MGVSHIAPRRVFNTTGMCSCQDEQLLFTDQLEPGLGLVLMPNSWIEYDGPDWVQ